MSGSWEFFLALVLLCLVVQGFFAMLEMASVSFNKVRLQYYVSKNNWRAIWLAKLLQSPGKLFGTSLIAINAALQLGSECARRFYDSLGLNPDLAPLTQVIIVLVLAEISPLFAGRRYAESAAMLGIPVLYAMSKVLSPVIFLLDGLCKGIYHFIGRQQEGSQYLSREELQKIFEEREEDDFNLVATHIFRLKTMKAAEIMIPLEKVQKASALCTVAQLRALLKQHPVSFLPIYHKSESHIVAMAYPRDLLRVPEHKRVREFARSPWFITEKDSVLEILKQFRKNNHSSAVVLSESGMGVGILTLDKIVDEIFGRSDGWNALEAGALSQHPVLLDRTFAAEMEVAEFNRLYQAQLTGGSTLGDVIIHALGHIPLKGESVRLGVFELRVEEGSLLGIKSVAVRTLQ